MRSWLMSSRSRRSPRTLCRKRSSALWEVARGFRGRYARGRRAASLGTHSQTGFRGRRSRCIIL